MARDEGLETVVAEDLAGLDDLRKVKMFGGLAWMLRGNLLCGARHDGVLCRLGKGNDGWTAAIPTAAPMVMGERRMEGLVRLPPEGAADDALRARFLAAARAFVESLPPK
jgi:hypothetical protein